MSTLSTMIVCKDLGLQEYRQVWAQMQTFTDARNADTEDEIWLLQHPPVFTVGLNGDMQHVLDPGDIPVIRIDRGGQVTFHGPGQLVVYPLIDLRRRKMGVRALVGGLERAVIETLGEFGVTAATRRDAPGVYVAGRKIASLGLRIRKGCSYHGLAFNVNMDLAPFKRINPCGFDNLAVTMLAELGVTADPNAVAAVLKPRLLEQLAR